MNRPSIEISKRSTIGALSRGTQIPRSFNTSIVKDYTAERLEFSPKGKLYVEFAFQTNVPVRSTHSSLRWSNATLGRGLVALDTSLVLIGPAELPQARRI